MTNEEILSRAMDAAYRMPTGGNIGGNADERIRAAVEEALRLTALSAGEELREAAERVVVRIRAEGGHGQRVHQLVEELASALAAPAPQEQAQCPSCDGLLDTAGCTCPAPPASAPEGDGA